MEQVSLHFAAEDVRMALQRVFPYASYVLIDHAVGVGRDAALAMLRGGTKRALCIEAMQHFAYTYFVTFYRPNENELGNVIPGE
jgi:hypothetical protein